MQPRRKEIEDILSQSLNNSKDFRIKSLIEIGRKTRKELILISKNQCKGLFKRLGSEEEVERFIENKNNINDKIFIVDDLRSFSRECQESIYDIMSKNIIYNCNVWVM